MSISERKEENYDVGVSGPSLDREKHLRNIVNPQIDKRYPNYFKRSGKVKAKEQSGT